VIEYSQDKVLVDTHRPAHRARRDAGGGEQAVNGRACELSFLHDTGTLAEHPPLRWRENVNGTRHIMPCIVINVCCITATSVRRPPSTPWTSPRARDPTSSRWTA